MIGAQEPTNAPQAGMVRDNGETLYCFREPDHENLLEQGEGTFDVPNQSGGNEFNVLVNQKDTPGKDPLWDQDSNPGAGQSPRGIQDCLLEDDSDDEDPLSKIPVTGTTLADDKDDS